MSEFDVETVIGFDTLYESARKCLKGVMWKDSAAHYGLNILEETVKLEEQLKDGSYQPRPTKSFTVTHPKKRDIVSVAFRDRVYQRSLNDNVLYPAMSRSFIRDNAACQKDKGADFARERLKCHMQRQFRKFGTDFWVLQCDVQHYYQEMRHDVVLKKFRQKLEPEVYARAEKILVEQYAGDTGFLPGSQMVQIAGISALDGLDHYIKEQLHIRGYVRYMDDFILLHPDKSYLEYCRMKISNELDTIGFHLHPDKTRIYPVTDGIPFLGFVFRPTSSGKILMLLKSDNVRAERRKLRRMVGLAQKGRLDRAKVDECYAAWKAHAAKGNTYHIIRKMDAYYKSLWEV